MCHLLHLSIILSNIYFHSRALITRQGADLSLSTARRQAHQLQSAGSLELTGHQVNIPSHCPYTYDTSAGREVREKMILSMGLY